ncbi:MAG: 2-phospho-L-lactate guanylyltransferase [Actinobacteria bacterium]|nr:2-phospho-L-lactate guanylyltransferase [Actinomycetota bacterium]
MTGADGGTLVLVPVRSPGEGKTRLATALSQEERAALSGAMLADVTAALAASRVGHVLVVAGGAPAAAAASALGLDVVLDPPTVRTLDAAVAAAASRLGPVPELLVVAADLPRLTGADVDALLDCHAQVAVAPTDDGGTGGLLRRPGAVVATAYGPDSAAHHLAAARAAGVPHERIVRPGFAADVDTWADVTALTRGAVGAATTAFLRSISTRLEAAG